MDQTLLVAITALATAVGVLWNQERRTNGVLVKELKLKIDAMDKDLHEGRKREEVMIVRLRMLEDARVKDADDRRLDSIRMGHELKGLAERLLNELAKSAQAYERLTVSFDRFSAEFAARPCLEGICNIPPLDKRIETDKHFSPQDMPMGMSI